MRLITSADEELFLTASVAGKLGRTRPLVERLQERYDAAPHEPEAAFEYALALTAALPSITSDFEVHAAFGTIVEMLGGVVDAAPDHWLARYCRARLRALVPTSYSVFTIYTESELSKAAVDIGDLVLRQSRQRWMPYFASTHLLAAFIQRMADESGTTVDPPLPVADLLDAVTGRPHHPVAFPALGAMLCEPFVALHDLWDGPRRARLGEVMAALFPGQPAVERALAGDPLVGT